MCFLINKNYWWHIHVWKELYRAQYHINLVKIKLKFYVSHKYIDHVEISVQVKLKELSAYNGRTLHQLPEPGTQVVLNFKFINKNTMIFFPTWIKLAINVPMWTIVSLSKHKSLDNTARLHYFPEVRCSSIFDGE